MYSGSRTLIVKEGSYVPRDSNATSLPAWIGPGHYPDAAKIPSYNRHDTQACLPFKSQSRYSTSEEVNKRIAINRRRRVISEHKERINTGESLSSSRNHRSRGSGNDSMTLQSLDTGFGEGSSILDYSNHQPLHPTALELAKADLLGDEPQLEVEVPISNKKEYIEDDDGGLSLVSTLSYNSTAIHSRSSTANRMKKLHNVEFIDNDNNNKCSTAETTGSTTPRTSSSSLYNQSPGKSILKSYRHSVPLPQRQAPVLNPVYTRKDLTAKLIQADDRINSNFFKVKDYTMNAFGLHPPNVSYINEFEPAEAEGSVDSSAGVYANRMSGLPTRVPKSVGAYTSEIFIVKPPEYVPNRPDKPPSDQPPTVTASSSSAKLPEGSKRNLTIVTSRSSSVIGIATSAAGAGVAGMQRSNSNKPVFSPSSSGRNSLQSSPLPTSTTNNNTTVLAKHLPLSEPSPTRRSCKPYQPAVLSRDIQTDRDKSERTIDKVIRRRHDSTYFQQQNKALIDENILTGITSPYEPNHTITSTTNTTSTAANPLPDITIPLTESVLNSSKNVNKWLNSNQIIRKKSNKKFPNGESFLKERIELPSIALSLTGLLLEENPYSPNKDEFMRELYHRSASEIGI